MVDEIKPPVSDEEIKAFYEQGRKDVYVRVTHTGQVRRHHIGEVGYDDLGTRAEAVELIKAMRGLA